MYKADIEDKNAIDLLMRISKRRYLKYEDGTSRRFLFIELKKLKNNGFYNDVPEFFNSFSRYAVLTGAYLCIYDNIGNGIEFRPDGTGRYSVFDIKKGETDSKEFVSSIRVLLDLEDETDKVC